MPMRDSRKRTTNRRCPTRWAPRRREGAGGGAHLRQDRAGNRRHHRQAQDRFHTGDGQSVSGRVTARFAQPGLFVQPATAAPFSVADFSKLWMVANVPKPTSRRYAAANRWR